MDYSSFTWAQTTVKPDWTKSLLLLITIGCIALFIVAVILINRDNSGKSHTAYVTAITPTTTGPLPKSTVGFKNIQTINYSDIAGGTLAVGSAMATTLEWLAIAQTNPAIGVDTTSIYMYKNSAFGTSTADPAYTYVATLTAAGGQGTPILAMSRFNGLNNMSISVQNLAGTYSVINYSAPGGIWAALPTLPAIFADPIDSLAQWSTTTAVVSGGVVYLYVAGVSSVVFSDLSATSVAIDGVCEYIVLLIGGQGAAYLYKKLASEPCWGYPLNSYLGTNARFAEQVAISLPSFAISDYDNSRGTALPSDCVLGQCRVLIYSLDAPSKLDGMLLLDQTLMDQYQMVPYNSGLILYTNLGASLFTGCNNKWAQSYNWYFPNSTAQPVVATGYLPLVAIRNSVTAPAPNTMISLYAQTCLTSNSTATVYNPHSLVYATCNGTRTVF